MPFDTHHLTGPVNKISLEELDESSSLQENDIGDDNISSLGEDSRPPIFGGPISKEERREGIVPPNISP